MRATRRAGSGSRSRSPRRATRRSPRRPRGAAASRPGSARSGSARVRPRGAPLPARAEGSDLQSRTASSYAGRNSRPFDVSGPQRAAARSSAAALVIRSGRGPAISRSSSASRSSKRSIGRVRLQPAVRRSRTIAAIRALASLRPRISTAWRAAGSDTRRERRDSTVVRWRSSSAASSLRIAKRGSTPASSGWSRKRLAHQPWKVVTGADSSSRSVSGSAIRARIRSWSSRAARSVNVRQRISRGPTDSAPTISGSSRIRV